MALALNKDGTLRVAERDVQKAVTDPFGYYGWLVIRTHAGLAASLDGRRRIRLGPKGRPDLLVIQPHRAVWIELKKPKEGRLSPQQRAWRSWLKKNGYEYLLLRSAEEAEKWLEDQ